MRRIPLIRVVEWIEGSEVRVFFSDGCVREVVLPTEPRYARRAHVVDQGVGLDMGDGRELASSTVRRVLSGCSMRFIKKVSK